MLRMMELSHFAFLVHDIDAAVVDVGNRLGITFAEVVTMTAVFCRPCNGEELEARLRIGYSRQGPPYCELIQPLDDIPVYTPPEFGRLHHVGGYVPELEKTLDEVLNGSTLDTLVRTPEGVLVAAYTTQSPETYGVRFEFIDIFRKETLERWARTGKRD
jgi:hypothetical protein